jgi:hypothetical protein
MSEWSYGNPIPQRFAFRVRTTWFPVTFATFEPGNAHMGPCPGHNGEHCAHCTTSLFCKNESYFDANHLTHMAKVIPMTGTSDWCWRRRLE